MFIIIFLTLYIPDVVETDPMVGLQSNYYAVNEGDGSIEICAEITPTPSEGNILIGYSTIGATAEGNIM